MSDLHLSIALPADAQADATRMDEIRKGLFALQLAGLPVHFKAEGGMVRRVVLCDLGTTTSADAGTCLRIEANFKAV